VAIAALVARCPVVVIQSEIVKHYGEYIQEQEEPYIALKGDVIENDENDTN
jgi:hypothetical protein